MFSIVFLTVGCRFCWQRYEKSESKQYDIRMKLYYSEKAFHNELMSKCQTAVFCGINFDVSEPCCIFAICQ